MRRHEPLLAERKVSQDPGASGLLSVTFRSLPAPAQMRPPGRKWKSASKSAKAFSHCSGSVSAWAMARLTRRRVSASVVSGDAPSSSRYFDCQMVLPIAVSSARSSLAQLPPAGGTPGALQAVERLHPGKLVRGQRFAG